ncbi:MAG: B12-binding domain-containing radical SAM protein [Spirochaetaceae bacterium]|nr:B12-binding domain-containing radical SAM protein [Spirochaetaceae bacterium]
MSRVALVAMAAPSRPESAPLGAASFAAAIAGSASVHILEPRAGEAPAALASRILSSGARAVGFSVYSWNRIALSETARALRRTAPGLALFAGGPEATADPTGLALEAGLDFVVAGEGEGAAAEVLRIIARIEEAGDEPPAARILRSPALEAADLPSPWIAGILKPGTLHGELPWELARGCPYACAFCYESKGDRRVRRLPLERIKAELKLLSRAAAERGGLEVFVLDPTFNAERGRALELLDLFAAEGGGIRWKFEIRAELVDRELAGRFARLDCSLQIGLQSANPRALAAVGRGLDRKAFARKTAILGRAGVVFGLDLIYGLPGDCLADIEESLDWALGLGPNHLDVFPLALLPGTRLHDEAQELGIRADPRPPYLATATNELPEEDFARAALLAAACDRYYTKGRAVGWFLAALRPLRMRPSAYLRELARSAATGVAAPPGAESLVIEAQHLAALDRLYRAKSLDRALPALRDIVRFNGAWGRALAEGISSEFELSYPYEDIAGPASLDLLLYARSARPGHCRIVVGPGKDGVEIAAAGRGRKES